MPLASERRGFTTIEIGLTLALCGIVAGLVAPRVLDAVRRSRVRAVAADLRRVETALHAYYADVASFRPLRDVGCLGERPELPAARHFLLGDGRPGWDGPYLERIPSTSPFGGRYDVDVLGPRSASIDLGLRDELGESFEPLLEALDAELDGDGDPARGRVWGDANGIHYGVNCTAP